VEHQKTPPLLHVCNESRALLSEEGLLRGNENNSRSVRGDLRVLTEDNRRERQILITDRLSKSFEPARITAGEIGFAVALDYIHLLGLSAGKLQDRVRNTLFG
jgi:hypothetical protein